MVGVDSGIAGELAAHPLAGRVDIVRDADTDEAGNVDIGQGTWPREQQMPEALAAQQKAEIEKWWPIIKAAGIKGE